MLAALTSSSLAPGTSARNGGEEQPPPPQPAKSLTTETNTLPVASPDTDGRRRSLRLSAKHATAGGTNPDRRAADDGVEAAAAEVATSGLPEPDASTFAPSNEAAPSDTVIDSELQADFTDDEVEAEVDVCRSQALCTDIYPGF